jgi:myo-inositol-1(or 4)-monophosphatase
MNTKIPLDKALNVAIEAAQAAGKILLRYWGNLSQIREKDTAWNLVTEADRFSEDVIKDILKRDFPNYSILAEESGLETAKDKEFLWAVDPLDGTTNYTHQFPMVGISIGLLYQNKPVVGVVYDPIHNELFEAVKGKGAFLNKSPIKVSKTSQLSKSLLATGFAYDRLDVKDNNYLEFCFFTNHTHGVRRLGAASLDLAYTACGRLDGFWERGLKLWDVAAGSLLITEAGGKVSAYDGGEVVWESGEILTSNGFLHDQMSKELVRIRDLRIKDNISVPLL